MSNLLSPGSLTALPALLAVGIAVTGVVALAAAGWARRRRATRSEHRQGSPAVKVAALAAVGCTAYSADTSGASPPTTSTWPATLERAAMFGAAELALFATALMARQNLNTQGTPGLPGSLVWVITGVQIIPAYAESGPVGGTVRAFVGPVMAAMLWHLAMGIELRLHKPDAASQGLLASLGREARERLLSRLGIAVRDRDAAQITRDRATARAVTLATRLAEHTPAQRQKLRGRRLTRRLSKALGRAAVGSDPAQRAQLLDQLAARRHAHALATVPLPSPGPPRTTNRLIRGQARSPQRRPGPPRSPATVPARIPNPSGTGQPGPNGGPVPKSTSHSTETDMGTGRGPDPESRHQDTGTERFAGKMPAHNPQPHRGPKGTKSGTDPTGDRGPTGTVQGTGTDSGTGAGTGRGGDRGPVGSVPARRKPKGKSKRKRTRAHQAKGAPRGPALPVEQLVTRVRPHVPALLERDGNETVTRVQLREILRHEGLKGGRNDRLGLVLQNLRTETTT